MPVLSRDREEDVPKCPVREISGSREMPFGNADLIYFICENTLNRLNNKLAIKKQTVADK